MYSLGTKTRNTEPYSYT